VFCFGDESRLKKSCLPVSFLAACNKNVHIMFFDIKESKNLITYTYKYKIKTTDKEVTRGRRQRTFL
jgi:hypothetical protein